MAGLIGSVSGVAGGSLINFITGTSAASSLGRVEQFRNNLSYDYGEILAGASSEGTIFDIRINNPKDYEFGPNLSFTSRMPVGLIDAGDSFAMEASMVRERLEMQDISRMAFGLLLAAKGEITETELNDNPAYSSLNALNLNDALDRLNIDSERPFRINKVEFEVVDGAIRVNSRPGEAAGKQVKRDAELEKLKSKLASKREALDGGGELEIIDAEGASINELIFIREDLEQKYTYIAYDFDNNKFIGSNDFSDILPALAGIPDSFFFGANVAYQLEIAMGDDISTTAKNEIFPVTLNYFANLMMGALTGLPTQLRSEFEDHAGNLLYNLYQDEPEVIEILDTLRPTFEATVQSVLQTVSQVQMGADIKELRKGMGVSFTGGTYATARFTPVT